MQARRRQRWRGRSEPGLADRDRPEGPFRRPLDGLQRWGEEGQSRHSARKGAQSLWRVRKDCQEPPSCLEFEPSGLQTSRSSERRRTRTEVRAERGPIGRPISRFQRPTSTAGAVKRAPLEIGSEGEGRARCGTRESGPAAHECPGAGRRRQSPAPVRAEARAPPRSWSGARTSPALPPVEGDRTRPRPHPPVWSETGVYVVRLVGRSAPTGPQATPLISDLMPIKSTPSCRQRTFVALIHRGASTFRPYLSLHTIKTTIQST